jgi:hypothetical protein
MLRRKVLPGLAAIVMGASLIFTPKVLAHSIDLEAAWEKARDHARSVRNDSNGNYKHYATDCVKAFTGHNHYVRCTIFFQTEKDKERGKWTCRERVEVYHEAHGRTGPGGIYERFGNDTMYLKHTSQKIC